MARRKERSTSPQLSTSTTGSSSNSSSSSSSSSSTSSSESSSSDTDQSSAASTRSRQVSRSASTDKDLARKTSSNKKSSNPSVKQPQSNGNLKRNQKASTESIDPPPTPKLTKSRASSDSEHESAALKRGPKTSATSIPKNSASNSASHRRSIQKSSSSGHSQSASASSKDRSHNVKASSAAISNSKKPQVKKSLSEQTPKKISKKHLPALNTDTDSEVDIKTSSKVNKKHSTSKPTQKNPAPKSTPKKSSNHRDQKKVKTPIQRAAVHKTPEKSSESCTNSSSVSSASDSDSTSVSTSSEKVPLDDKKQADASSEKENDDDEEEEEESTPRLVTRSSTVKNKRSNLLGISKGTDSDSENGGKSKAPRSNRQSGSKKVPVRVPATPREHRNSMPYSSTNIPLDASCTLRPSKGHRSKTKKTVHKVKNAILEPSPLPPIENRSCPVDGCNSTGHLGGRHNSHFTVDACPIYHNLTKEDCKVNYDLRQRENEERNRLKAFLASRSPKNSSTSEQRNYCNKIRDSRDAMSEVLPGEDEMADSDRQPSLKGLTPQWDLNLFMEAQAEASIKTEDEMRGLRDTKGIRYLQMGHYLMEAWYQSQYPDDYNQQPKIFVCEFCLKYMRSRTVLCRHMAKCVWRYPPGDEIYRKDKLSVWEVDGSMYKTYCQNLCLLAMLFLDHKTLYYDVEPFLFYIMTLADSEGCHIVGYFSKEKNSFLNYNVSCIMTLPPYQRQGFGRLLIDFSYLLTKEEGKIGSPEKPLSDLGLISYRSYWKDLLLKYLNNFSQKSVCIKDISAAMAVNSYDIVSTFQAMGMMKYWKGKHILLRRQDLFEDFNERAKNRKSDHREIVRSGLDWRPYVPPPTDDNQNNHNISNNNHVNNFNSTNSSSHVNSNSYPSNKGGKNDRKSS